MTAMTALSLVHHREDLEQLAILVSDQRRKTPKRRPRPQRQKQKRKDSSRIPRPVNCFMAYRLEMQKTITEQCPGANHRDISKLVAKWWRKEPNHIKDHFKQVAEKAKQEHSEMYPNYKYSPRRNRSRHQQQQQQQPQEEENEQELQEQLQGEASEHNEEVGKTDFGMSIFACEQVYRACYYQQHQQQSSVSPDLNFLVPPPIFVEEPIALGERADVCYDDQHQQYPYQLFPYASTSSTELEPAQQLVPPLSPFASGSSASGTKTGICCYSPLSPHTPAFDMTQYWIMQQQQQHQQQQYQYQLLTPSNSPYVLSHSSTDSTCCSPNLMDFQVLGMSDQPPSLYPAVFHKEDLSSSIYY